MIGKSIRYVLSGITPVQLDGLLYVLIATFGAVQTFMSSDDAYKYVSATTLFWIKFLDGIALAGVSALKMFRSTSYADHVKEGVSKQPENG